MCIQIIFLLDVVKKNHYVFISHLNFTLLNNTILLWLIGKVKKFIVFHPNLLK